jgi:hypothetical protein
MILPVTAAHARQLSAIQLHELDGVSDLHPSFDFATVYDGGLACGTVGVPSLKRTGKYSPAVGAQASLYGAPSLFDDSRCGNAS